MRVCVTFSIMCALWAWSLPAYAQTTTAKKPITFEDLYGSQARLRPFAHSRPSFRWLADGKRLLRIERGQAMVIDAQTGAESPLYDRKTLTAALQKSFGFAPDVAERFSSAGRLTFSPGDRAAIFEHDNNLFYIRLDGAAAHRLTRTPQREELTTFSPQGDKLAFVREDDLYVVDIATQTETRLTRDGGGPIRNGKADWVYWEEVFSRDSQAFWFSDDGSQILFFRFDDTPVAKFTIPDNRQPQQRVREMYYPKAGTKNPLVSAAVASLSVGSVCRLDLSAYPETDRLLVRGGWLPDSRTVYLYIQNRTQTWLDLLFLKPGEKIPAAALRQKTEAWVNDPGPPEFLKDGSFLLSDESSGWRRLVRHTRDSPEKKFLTDGEWEAHEIHHVDEERRMVYFSGSKDSPLETQLYRAPLSGGEPQRLTAEPGTHRIQFSPAGGYYLDTHSSLTRPPVTVLCDRNGQVLRTLHQSSWPEFDDYQFGQREQVEIVTDAGVPLPAMILKPADFDPQRRYPVWFQVYGGPHYPTLKDRYDQPYRLFDELLAAEGIVVIRFDPHSASGRGAKSAWTAYRQLGVNELRDLEAVVAWVKSQTWADPDRIGLSGHSYGGYLTAFAMTHSRSFAAGIAGAPVTDWRNYDTIYTERYMSTPQENPQGYDASSVVKAAGNLHGRLLLLHGLLDDNVHWQNSVQLAEALEEANRPFELMIYPGANHGIHGAHYVRTKYDFIMKTMRPEKSPAEKSP